MMDGTDKDHSLEPYVGFNDYSLLKRTTWDGIDEKASELLDRKCLGVPSVRVGICWTLEYFGYNRHRDHVLVPKYIGRCILNSLNRHALPVEGVTPETRLVIVVHEYGLKQRLDLIAEECDSKGLHYIEDSPYGLGAKEELGLGSLGRFIGLSKIFPVLKGALVISHDESLLAFIKRKRQEASLWSWAVLGAMALVRRRRKVGSYSALADAAYEMYVECKGDNFWLRGNVLCAMERLDSFATQARQRLSLIEERIKERVVIPDTGRMPYGVPYFPDDDLVESQEAFRLNGFDSNLYHIDVARNLFCPLYKKFLLIPVNPRIPGIHFERLVDDLAMLATSDNKPFQPGHLS